MSEVFFFFSANDPSIAVEALRLGNHLIVNKAYEENEGLIIISSMPNIELELFRRFYIIPSNHFVSEISMDDAAKNDDDSVRYIMQRVGAAAIDLILYRNPSSEDEVCVGSLGFYARTYRSAGEPLEPRPAIFSRTFQSLLSYIRRSAQPVSNAKSPKTVYVFPQAMALLRQDFSRSPWPSLKITG